MVASSCRVSARSNIFSTHCVILLYFNVNQKKGKNTNIIFLKRKRVYDIISMYLRYVSHVDKNYSPVVNRSYD